MGKQKGLFCKSPDIDVPGLKCGHPLPCPYHTAIIDVSHDIAELRIPITAKATLRGRHHLEDIGAVLLIGDYIVPTYSLGTGKMLRDEKGRKLKGM